MVASLAQRLSGRTVVAETWIRLLPRCGLRRRKASKGATGGSLDARLRRLKLLFSIPPSDAPGPCVRARETVKLLSFPCISFSESSLFNGLRQISRVPSPGRLAPPPPGHVPRLKAGVGSKSSQRNATHQGIVSDFRHKFFSWPFPSGRPPRAAPRPIVCMRPQAERVRWRRTLGFLLGDGGARTNMEHVFNFCKGLLVFLAGCFTRSDRIAARQQVSPQSPD